MTRAPEQAYHSAMLEKRLWDAEAAMLARRRTQALQHASEALCRAERARNAASKLERDSV